MIAISKNGPDVASVHKFWYFVKSMPPSLSKSKVTPSFCFPLKIPDDPTTTNKE